MLRKWHTEAKTGVLSIKLGHCSHRSGTVAMHPRFSNLVLTTTALIALGMGPAAGGPAGGTVVGGSATVQGQGGPTVTVKQSTNSAIINWNTFNIGVDESGASISRARVGRAQPRDRRSRPVADHRHADCRTAASSWSIRDGILFGSGAVVEHRGLPRHHERHQPTPTSWPAGTTSTFRAGRMPRSSIRARSRRTSGGFAALVAPGVRNSGTITATLGTVALASGNGFTLDFYGDKLITLAVDDQIAAQGHRRRHRPAAQFAGQQERAARSAPTAAGSNSPPRRRARWSIPSSTPRA